MGAISAEGRWVRLRVRSGSRMAAKVPYLSTEYLVQSTEWKAVHARGSRGGPRRGSVSVLGDQELPKVGLEAAIVSVDRGSQRDLDRTALA